MKKEPTYYIFSDGIYEAKEEKPERKNFTKRSTNNQEEFWFKKCTNKWLSSCIIHPFGEGEEEKFKELAIQNYIGNTGCVHPNWNEDLNSGILLPSERVRIKTIKFKELVKFDNEYLDHEWQDRTKQAAYFVPIEDKPKEESQEELLNELIKTVTGLSVPTELLIKGNGFHITRK